MEIAILLFVGITALDAIGPYEVLSRMPNTRVKFVGKQVGPVKTDNQMCTVVADYSITDVRKPDILVIPGGWGADEVMKDLQILEWVQSVHQTSIWTTSVCTGSLVLASTGILKGQEATTHWTALEELKALGASAVSKRVVKSGKIVTSAGVSAGIDMALQLSAWIGGEDLAKKIQLSMEYDPQPPFDAGTPAKAGDKIVCMINNK